MLEHGRVAQVGPIAEVAARPRSRYVADLVGINLLRGHADGTETTLDTGGVVVTADAEHGDVYIAVHPSKWWTLLLPALVSLRYCAVCATPDTALISRRPISPRTAAMISQSAPDDQRRPAMANGVADAPPGRHRHEHQDHVAG